MGGAQCPSSKPWVHHGGFDGRDQSLCPLQTLQEIAELQEDIRHLEEDLRRKLLNLKLCHTRLESRTYRPNVELCRDQVQGYPNWALPPCQSVLRITHSLAHIPGGAGVLS